MLCCMTLCIASSTETVCIIVTHVCYIIMLAVESPIWSCPTSPAAAALVQLLDGICQPCIYYSSTTCLTFLPSFKRNCSGPIGNLNTFHYKCRASICRWCGAGVNSVLLVCFDSPYPAQRKARRGYGLRCRHDSTFLIYIYACTVLPIPPYR